MFLFLYYSCFVVNLCLYNNKISVSIFIDTNCKIFFYSTKEHKGLGLNQVFTGYRAIK